MYYDESVMASANLHRRSIRLPGRDYAFSDRYFVTICAAGRKCILGRIDKGAMKENELGLLVRACWMQIPHHFANVEPDAFLVMPNHIHGLILLHKMPEMPGKGNARAKEGTIYRAPTNSRQTKAEEGRRHSENR